MQLQGTTRIAVSAATVVAFVIVASAGVGAIAFYSAAGGFTAGEVGPSPTATSVSTSNQTTSTATVSTTTCTVCTTYLSTSSTPSSSEWDPGIVANITLGYQKDYGYVRQAWNYTYAISQTGSNPVLLSNVIQTLGPLAPYGNWSTGYALNFTRAMEFNVTVQFTPPDQYQVVGFSSHNSTVPAETLRFNSTQKGVIAVAMGNPTVKADISQRFDGFGFVGSAIQPFGENRTYAGDYLVTVYQWDGSGTVNAIVNPTAGQVVSVYNSTRQSRTCYADGICFNDPWF